MDTISVEHHHHQDDTTDAPHACLEGYVFVGYIVEDEHGEPVEIQDRIPCRRCRG